MNKLLNRIFKRTYKSPDGCWLWTGTTSNGYGKIDVKDPNWGWKPKFVHRLLFQVLYGPVGDAKILHRCNNSRCINPNHLYIGSLSDNSRDSIRAGTHPTVKLSETSVRQIRYARNVMGFKLKDIAKIFEVTEATICDIAHGKVWRWVK